jgi:DnaK suppressor protein
MDERKKLLLLNYSYSVTLQLRFHLRGGVLMNTDFTELHSELLMMQQELENHLHQEYTPYNQEIIEEPLFSNTLYEKKQLIQKHIHDDLKDVKRALLKLEYGLYGICEDTGERISLEKLKTIPTARSIHDFSYKDLVRI